MAIVSLPLVAGLVVGSRFSTGASGLYLQRRIGRHGKPFTMLKIRSMTATHGGSTITSANDARVTTLGARLRRYKLDELPQFWNVVAGTMSLVGPRPDVAGYADRLEGEARQILDLRPGITGPASIAFRHEERLLAEAVDAKSFNDTVLWPQKVVINVAYAQNATLADDLRLIAQTVRPNPEGLCRMLHRWNVDLSALDVVTEVCRQTK